MILSQIYDDGRIEVKDIANQLSISEATVRRDLRALARNKQIDLVYGGAQLPKNSDFAFHTKAVREIEAKRKIGRLAARLVEDNDQVFLDSGTTCYQMIHHLKMRNNLSVIANSLNVAAELGQQKGIQVIQIGGTFRPDRSDTVGPLALSVVDQLRGYKAFIGADGLSTDFGVSACDMESAHLYRSVIHHARETILLVDHTKFQAPSLYKITDFDSINKIITDQAPSNEWANFMGEMGIEFICPENAPDIADMSIDE